RPTLALGLAQAIRHLRYPAFESRRIHRLIGSDAFTRPHCIQLRVHVAPDLAIGPNRSPVIGKKLAVVGIASAQTAVETKPDCADPIRPRLPIYVSDDIHLALLAVQLEIQIAKDFVGQWIEDLEQY